MSGIEEFFKGEKSFYKYTKQTILHLIYRILGVLIVFFCFIISVFALANNEKDVILITIICITGALIFLIILFILWAHIYFIHVKKDITPLQSEHHQLARELLTRIQGDSLTGMSVIDGIKALSQEGGQNQNG
jgi:protein-S-isoprenylcysteine O-methyltransferase Ste14